MFEKKKAEKQKAEEEKEERKRKREEKRSEVDQKVRKITPAVVNSNPSTSIDNTTTDPSLRVKKTLFHSCSVCNK